MLLSCFNSLFGQNKTMPLNGTWQFKAASASEWQNAQVPGNVYLDLEQNGLIPNPLFGANEEKVRWVDSLEWQYRKIFSLSHNQIKAASILLQLAGLDTEADLFLNGKKLGKVNNMFRSWEYEVKTLVKVGENELFIHFYPALEVARQAKQNTPLPLPGGDAPFIRKAQYQFGWDWAPRLLGCGIWKEVSLAFKETQLALTQPFIQTKALDAELATVQFNGSVHGNEKLDWVVETRLFDGKKWLTKQLKKENSLSGAAYSTKIDVTKPELWWPNGQGEARLYPVEVKLFVGKKLVDEKRFKIGLRTIEWVQQPDSLGASFLVKVNGKPIFVKGANWVPPDQFPARISPAQYHKQVALAADAHVNMLRVWGGGIYADEAFLDDCDSLGILVWQDFMFACALYPADQAFQTNVYLEASQQIERMRNRASLALWCGNNEISEGWFNWGWQKSLGYRPEDSLLLYQQYEKLFHQILPKLVADGHPSAYYHPSSPSNGWGRDTAYKSGDVHYWGVWWGFAPFESYRAKIGRFVSEYGFQGFPSPKTQQLMTLDLSGDSVPYGLAAHQKHPIGDSTIRTYMARDYPVPADPEKFTYVSQILQARGMQIAIESHRFAQPYCMGSMFWQWNDCWPAISWSAIDYLDQPKAFYYQAKRSFAPTLLRIDTAADQILFERVSDKLLLEKNVTLQVQVGTLDGYVLKDTSISLYPNDSPNQLLTQLPAAFLPQNVSKNNFYLHARLISRIGSTWTTPFYWVSPKYLALQKSEIKWAFKSPNILVLEADKLVKDLEITAPGLELADNYFDLVPGKPKQIHFKRKAGETIGNLSFKSLVDCF